MGRIKGNRKLGTNKGSTGRDWKWSEGGNQGCTRKSRWRSGCGDFKGADGTDEAEMLEVEGRVVDSAQETGATPLQQATDAILVIMKWVIAVWMRHTSMIHLLLHHVQHEVEHRGSHKNSMEAIHLKPTFCSSRFWQKCKVEMLGHSGHPMNTWGKL